MQDPRPQTRTRPQTTIGCPRGTFRYRDVDLETALFGLPIAQGCSEDFTVKNAQIGSFLWTEKIKQNTKNANILE
ncbi:unnamed protein product, partial [Nesidiocoris tenuis]